MFASAFPPEKSATTLALLLVVEASTTAGSVALFADGAPVAMRAVSMGPGREDQLFPAVQSVLADAGVTAPRLSGVVCGAGPGSFTSLRIAASIAKGLAHGASVPLFAVSSLLLAAADAVEVADAGPAVGQAVGQAVGHAVVHAVVHADALRGERYVLDVVLDANGQVGAQSALQRMSLDQLRLHAAGRPRLAVLSSPTPDLETRVVTPWSTNLLRVASTEWAGAVALDSWEPQYGRLAEAQVKWEASHGAPLPAHDAA